MTFVRFDSAEQVLFGVPMWNAGMRLKQPIDVIARGSTARRLICLNR
jgi:hypothetical protein